MGIDLSRMASAAIEAALEDERPRRRLRGLRAVAAGAALATAARVAVTKAPGVPRLLSGVTRLPDEARSRLADLGWLENEDVEDEEELDEEELDEEEFDEDEEPQGEADEEELEDEDFDEDEERVEDEEPQAEAGDEEPEAEEEEPEPEPEAEAEPDEEPEPEDVETEEHSSNGDEPAGAPPLVLSAHRSPRVMSRAGRGRRVDPANRPPKPPESDSHDNENGRSG